MMTRFQRCVSAACLFALAGGVSGQSKAPVGPDSVPAGLKGPAVEKSGEKSPEGARFDLEFKGGTVADYVTLLRSVAGVSANLMVTPETEDLPLGKVMLRQVTLQDAVQVIETASQQSGDWVTSAVLERRGGIWLVRAARNLTGRSASQRPSVGSIQVYNLTGAAGPTTSPETTLSAVEAAIRLIDRPSSQTQISYHKESGLLFVVGSEEAQESVRNVVRGIGANRDVAVQRAQGEAAAELFAMLGAGDVKSAQSRVQELMGMARKVEEEKVGAAVNLARSQAESQMWQVQLKQMQDRLVQSMEESKRLEQAYREKLDKMEAQWSEERRQMRDEIEGLRKALDATHASK